MFGYDEEGHLTSIGHNVAGTVTTLYQYGYGADGNRRWRKDLAGNVWTWYPCGVACSAGELVEQTSDLTGTTWATSGLYLRAGGGCSSQLVRRNAEYHHEDFLGNFGVITSGTGTVLSNNLYDAFQVQRFSSGTAVSPWRFSDSKTDVEGLLITDICYAIPERDMALTQQCQVKKGPPPRKRSPREMCQAGCERHTAGMLQTCAANLKTCLAQAKNDSMADVCYDKSSMCQAAAVLWNDHCDKACRKKYPSNPSPSKPSLPPGDTIG